MGILIFIDLGRIDKAAKEIVNELSGKIEETRRILCQRSQEKTVSRAGGGQQCRLLLRGQGR